MFHVIIIKSYFHLLSAPATRIYDMCVYVCVRESESEWVRVCKCVCDSVVCACVSVLRCRNSNPNSNPNPNPNPNPNLTPLNRFISGAHSHSACK